MAKQQNTHTRLCSCTVWPGFSIYIQEILVFPQWTSLSQNIRKCTLGHVHPAKIQISLCIRSLIRIFTGHILGSQGCKVSSCKEGSDQTVWMCKLIVFIGSTCQKIHFLMMLPIWFIVSIKWFNTFDCLHSGRPIIADLIENFNRLTADSDILQSDNIGGKDMTVSLPMAVFNL